MMVRKKSNQGLLWAATMAALLCQNLVVPVLSSATFEDQKNFFFYYPPPSDPNAGTPPAVPITPPTPSGSGGGHSTPTPSTPAHGTPSHGTPSHGSTPSPYCGTPPSRGHHHHHTPSPPRRSGGSSGGYHNSPPSSHPTPSHPSTPTPVIVNPPVVNPPSIGTPPIDPGTPSVPGISIPSPPISFDPSSPPFTCIYWRTHPGLIWGIFGWYGTVGGAFGVTSLPGFGSHMSLLDALSNTRTDGFGDLYREGTAALLNSMAHTKFPYTTTQVRNSFVKAMGSNKAAATQARLFKLANEGRIKPKA